MNKCCKDNLLSMRPDTYGGRSYREVIDSGEWVAPKCPECGGEYDDYVTVPAAGKPAGHPRDKLTCQHCGVTLYSWYSYTVGWAVNCAHARPVVRIVDLYTRPMGGAR